MNNALKPSNILELPIIGKIETGIIGEKDKKPFIYNQQILEVIFVESINEETIYWINDWENDLPMKVRDKYVLKFTNF